MEYGTNPLTKSTILTDPMVLRNSVRFFRLDFDLIDFAMILMEFDLWLCVMVMVGVWLWFRHQRRSAVDMDRRRQRGDGRAAAEWVDKWARRLTDTGSHHRRTDDEDE